MAASQHAQLARILLPFPSQLLSSDTWCRKHHEEAVKNFQHAVAAAPRSAHPLFRLGNALFATHQLQQSQEAFSQALCCASLPTDAALLPKIHLNLGISLEAEGKLEAACRHYRWWLA